jgi:hypothetical protein
MYVNMGKAIAVYERQLLPAASRFDNYVADLTAGRASDQLTADEVGTHVSRLSSWPVCWGPCRSHQTTGR